MAKIAETLLSLHRLLVLAATGLLLFAWKSGADEFRYTHTLYEAKLVLQQHAFLTGEIARASTHAYAQRWYDLLEDHIAEFDDRSLPNWLVDAVSTARILPATLAIRLKNAPKDAPPFVLDLVRNSLTLGELSTLATLRSAGASLVTYEFDDAELLSQFIGAARAKPPVFTAPDLTIYIGRPDADGRCVILFLSASAQAAGNTSGRLAAKCTARTEVDVSALVATLFDHEPSLHDYAISAPAPLSKLPYDATEPQLTALAAREQRQSDSELELLGLKVDRDLVGTVAPFVLFALLLQMLATLPRGLEPEEAAEGEDWFGLFDGWRFGMTLLTIVCLPVGAVVLTALRPNEDTPAWQTLTELVMAAAVGGLGIACVLKSRAIARRLAPGLTEPRAGRDQAESA